MQTGKFRCISCIERVNGGFETVFEPIYESNLDTPQLNWANNIGVPVRLIIQNEKIGQFMVGAIYEFRIENIETTLEETQERYRRDLIPEA